jgi:hypothetical protein
MKITVIVSTALMLMLAMFTLINCRKVSPMLANNLFDSHFYFPNKCFKKTPADLRLRSCGRGGQSQLFKYNLQNVFFVSPFVPFLVAHTSRRL